MLEDHDKDSASDAPYCFVAMPIKKIGTEEYKHFLAIYEIIADAIQDCGLRAIRADKVSNPGNINKDLIMRLAEAELVVADLTDANANVFYEIGIRHALRRSGTLLLLDRSRTKDIPFDLGQYRVIEYEGNLNGIGNLRTEIKRSIREVTPVSNGGAHHSDSPIHDWYPELPADLIATSRKGIDPEIIKELGELRKQVEHYRNSTSTKNSLTGTARTSNAQSIIQKLRQADIDGELPQHYIQEATEATHALNVPKFLDATEKLFRSKTVVDYRVYIQFSKFAGMMGLSDLRIAILHETSLLFPNQGQGAYLRALSGSLRKEDRDRARDELAASLGIDPKTGQLAAGASPSLSSNDLGFYLQMMREEDMLQEGLELIDSILEKKESKLLQKWRARQLAWLGRSIEALEEYRAGIDAAEPDEESILWFGDFMHNNGYHIEAAELYLLKAFYDLEDAKGIINFANEISFHLYYYFALPAPAELVNTLGVPRSMPAEMGVQVVREAAQIAYSIGGLSQEDHQDLEKTLRRADIMLIDEKSKRIGKNEQICWIQKMYEAFSSELTQDCSVARHLMQVSIYQE